MIRQDDSKEATRVKRVPRSMLDALISRWSFAPTVWRVKRRVKRCARLRGIAPVRVCAFGSVHIHPDHLSVWVKTGKDWERDQLRQDSTFDEEFRRALIKYGYPEASVAKVGLTIESQETVDRKCGGNWRYAMQ